MKITKENTKILNAILKADEVDALGHVWSCNGEEVIGVKNAFDKLQEHFGSLVRRTSCSKCGIDIKLSFMGQEYVFDILIDRVFSGDVPRTCEQVVRYVRMDKVLE